MTKQEYNEFKTKEEELDTQRNRIYKYEELSKKLNDIERNTASLNRVVNFGSVETTGDYVHIHITDKEFCREKLLEIFNREKDLLELKIKEL